MKVKGDHVVTTDETVTEAPDVLSTQELLSQLCLGHLKAVRVVQGDRVTDRSSEMETIPRMKAGCQG